MNAPLRRESLARLPLARSRIGGALLAAMGLALAAIIVFTPLAAEEQGAFALGGLLVAFLIGRFRGRAATLALAALSSMVSVRYIVWRLSDTLDYSGPLQTLLGIGLLLAELYAVIVLILAYAQTAWPLDRKPVPLPADAEVWPTVDVFIPTYNEALEVVKPTILAALALDWPAEKINIVVLDDGRRDEFRRFCAEVGAGYLIRPDNKGAKAGNINHALTKTSGEYVVIFDCDHVPTRAFLQLSMGWMLRDRGLCMVQTPHHFYSPDPFQRNLASGEAVPNEGLLFYGLVQPGNDFWGATFFCGSCAVIRRTALEAIGGVPTTTVTEDCHAALRMQKAGWRTAYLRVPMAAGLATERLMLHIGQRLRWGRGMIQILRTENPLTAQSLSWPQRLCYFMAMFSFLFPLPRFVFLTAPLAWLLLGETVIAASPLAILAYAGPHILHSVMTSSRVSGHVRHSFWSEIHEATLAVYLLPVTLMTLLDPRKGKFNVTDKGGTLQEGYFDLRALGPNIVLAGVLLCGVASGLLGILRNPVGTLEFQAYALNLFWCVLCLLTVAAGLAVGRERRQLRERARIAAALSGSIRLPDGTLVAAGMRDLSLGGAALDAPQPAEAPEGLAVILTLETNGEMLTIPSEVVQWSDGRVQLRFAPRSAEDEGAVVRAVFGRADAWLDWDRTRPDRPLRAFIEVIRSVAGLFRGDSQFSLRRRRTAGSGGAAASRPTILPPPLAVPALHRARGSRAAGLLLGLALGAPGLALAQPARGGRGRPRHPPRLLQPAPAWAAQRHAAARLRRPAGRAVRHPRRRGGDRCAAGAAGRQLAGADPGAEPGLRRAERAVPRRHPAGSLAPGLRADRVSRQPGLLRRDQPAELPLLRPLRGGVQRPAFRPAVVEHLRRLHAASHPAEAAAGPRSRAPAGALFRCPAAARRPAASGRAAPGGRPGGFGGGGARGRRRQLLVRGAGGLPRR
ncbi:UDP-forming cellulose synthase catalytic subunit [Roseicella sp. DB1501]|nr:UDP-forming cellulose synthase catalytic subunit [Roseicella sp. DB1501]